MNANKTPSENHGLRTKQAEKRHGENAPSPGIDDQDGDSLAEAFEACDGYALLSEALEPVDGGEPEPLQSASD